MAEAAEKELAWFRAAHTLLANDEAFIFREQDGCFLMGGETKLGKPTLALNLNDDFWWGTADAEGFRYIDAPTLLEIWKRDGHAGLMKWALEQRTLREPDAKLYDAAHVERYRPEVSLLARAEAAESRSATWQRLCESEEVRADRLVEALRALLDVFESTDRLLTEAGLGGIGHFAGGQDEINNAHTALKGEDGK
jgi:hypothetical protein